MPTTAGPSRTFTLILAGGKGERLYPLTQDRAKPAIPIGATHRLIDFTLSNCFNSGLKQIHILTQYCHESLHRYLDAFHRPLRPGTAQEQFSLSLCPPRSQPYCGTADAVFQNLVALEQSKSDLVLILSGDHVYKMDYRDLLDDHIKSGSEMTVAATECPADRASQFGVLEVDSNSKLIGFNEKPACPATIPNRPFHSLVSMGVYVFNTALLLDLLARDSEENTSHDFGRNIIPRMVGNRTSSVYNFADKGKKWGTYWRDVGTVDSFYRSNMDLLPSSVFKPSDGVAWPLIDSHRLRPADPDCRQDSIVAEGVFIETSAKVRQSVLSNGVQIHGRSRVENSILMANVRVGAGARIRRAIIDESVQVPAGMEIGYDSMRDREYGHISDEGIVVIAANTRLSLRDDMQFSAPVERIIVGRRLPVKRLRSKSTHVRAS